MCWSRICEELGLRRPVVAGYDVGSRVAQTLAAARPDLAGALILAPPLPGVGPRVLDEHAQHEFWYQAFHQLPVVEQLIDGKPEAIRDYLAHFWTHWSGPEYTPDANHLDHLVAVYGLSGALTASIAWYRAGAGTVAASLAEAAPDPEARMGVPTTVLWPEYDPLFPRAWSDRLEEFFSDVDLRFIDGIGHFVPLESPHLFAEEVAGAIARRAGHATR